VDLLRPEELQWCSIIEDSSSNAEVVCEGCVLFINVWDNSSSKSETGSTCIGNPS
jgi:hypothetical protein